MICYAKERFPDPPMSGWTTADVRRLLRAMLRPEERERLRRQGLTPREHEASLRQIARELEQREARR